MNDTPAAKYRNELINQHIKSINGKPVKEIYDVLRIMENIRPSTPITLKFDTDSVTMTSECLDESRLKEIAIHAVREHKDDCVDIEYDKSTVSIITNKQEKEIARTAGIKDELVYCLNGLDQLGTIVRIFGMHKRLKIGTDEVLNAGRWIYFSEDVDKRVLYY